jgi:hypothetical protein
MLPLLGLSPWFVRNYFVFHRIVPLRSNFGLELQISNNDCATAIAAVNVRTGCFARYHPYPNEKEALLVRELGEIRYNDLKLRHALTWIRNHPRRFLTLTVERMLRFWFPSRNTSPIVDLTVPGHRRRTILIYLATLLSLPGAVSLWKDRSHPGFALVLWLAIFPCVYYLHNIDVRYRIPIFWVTFLAAAHAGMFLWRRSFRGLSIWSKLSSEIDLRFARIRKRGSQE